MTKSPFIEKDEQAAEYLGLIRSNLYGPINIQVIGGLFYFITFTNDHSRYGYVNLMKFKSEAFKKFKEFKNEVEKLIGKSIKTLRSDQDGEYLSHKFIDYLKENRILPQWTSLRTP